MVLQQCHALCTLSRQPSRLFCNHGRSCSERAVRSYNVRSCSSSLLPLTLLMHNYCSATAAHDSSGSGPAEKASSQRKPLLPYYHVLLNAPNCVGWVRLSLLLLAVWKAGYGAHMATFCLCIVNMMLDFVDGWAARRFQQTTSFGAVFDVLLDVALRGWLWVTALPPSLALWVPLLELAVFAFTHQVSGCTWKVSFFAAAPGWVRAVMAGGFRSVPGAVVVLGLMGCPLWAWACRHLPGSLFAAVWWGWLLVPARLLAAAVEVWVVLHYMHLLLEADVAAVAAAAAAAAAAANSSDEIGSGGSSSA